MFLYLEFQAALAGQVPQHLPVLLEIQEAHIPLAQGSQLVPVCLKARVDLGNHGLPLPQRRDTREKMDNLFQMTKSLGWALAHG